jgi:fluoroacetyl-CoA thioesterase
MPGLRVTAGFQSVENILKDTLKPGITHQFSFRLPDTKTVPALYPESAEFQEMPEVFATGFMVGFLEWACIDAIKPHLDWPEEQSLGTHINVSHTAATPPGLQVTARVKLVGISGRRLTFEVEADDGVDIIAKGTHERFVIDRDRFNQKIRNKAAAAFTGKT